MPLNLAILCSAERLFPHDRDPVAVDLLLGVNIVAAAVPPVTAGDLDRRWLEPWRWSPVTAVRVRLLGTDPGATRSIVTSLRPSGHIRRYRPPANLPRQGPRCNGGGTS